MINTLHDNCAEKFADKEKKIVKTCLGPCLNLQNFLQIKARWNFFQGDSEVLFQESHLTEQIIYFN